ncbi:TRAP transporter large permease [Acidimangrovimonas sediminis]|uniref:TRAP transporter large permease n=1 Tax=Acidimangrovimonas sediminis TaxID=2056283 RepID=UPI0013049C12|nr:TRAP transporter large permease [Acidimangrovimonas sediminis]
MIAVAVFILFLIAFVWLSISGTAPDVSIWPIIGLCLLFAGCFAAGVYIAAILGVLGVVTGFVFSNRPFYDFLGSVAWTTSSDYVLIALPLFLLMGELLLRSGVSQKLYAAVNLWLNRVPGGLLHTNIVACAAFSAMSGSSIATAATMGSVALPQFEGTSYDRRMVLGSLAAGGALGSLIPPSTILIIYALLTNTSVGALYAAALLPALLVTALCLGAIFLHGLRNPLPAGTRRLPLTMKLRGTLGILPTVILILLVLGTIYSGLATPTEAAAFGVVGAMIFAAIGGELTLKMVNESAVSAARTTAMVGLILIAAFVLNYVLTSLRVPQSVAALIAGLPVPGWVIMAAIILVYLAMGTIMEGFSMVVTTIPVIFPVVTQLGYDPIWFGVMVTLLVEIALITPPDGTVMYVLQGLRKTGPITDIFSGVIPFLGAYLIAVALLLAFPSVALVFQ